MYESISKNNELENEMTLDMSYFWYSDDCGQKNLRYKLKKPQIWATFENRTITCMHSLLLMHKLHKSTGTTRMTRLIVQQPKTPAESTCKPMVLVENEWQYVIIVALKCKWGNGITGDDNCLWWGNIFCLPFNVNFKSLILTLQKSRAHLMKYIFWKR